MARTVAARVSDTDAVVRVTELRVVCGRRASVAEQRAIADTVALEVTGLPLSEARRHIHPRQWVIAALHAAGWSYQRIADAFGIPSRVEVLDAARMNRGVAAGRIERPT